MNVVEEMSIASGVPVPPVYFLANGAGINAFAAGYSPSDTVLGITRDAAEQLTHGRLKVSGALSSVTSPSRDMPRIGIQHDGVLYGILLMGFVGQLIFRTLAYGGGNRSRSDKTEQCNHGDSTHRVGGAIVLGFVSAVQAT
ncbi:MAG: hypothetical protein R3C56_35840 [Pirellulaceae bacterium]